MKVFLIVFFCLCSLSVFAQNAKIDSLKKVIATTKTDTVKGRTLCRLCLQLRGVQSLDEALINGTEGLKIAEKHQKDELIAFCQLQVGLTLSMKGNLDKAEDYLMKSLMIYERIGNSKKSAELLSSIGQIYAQRGDYPKALDFFQRSLTIHLKANDQVNMARILGNIGIIYDTPKNYNKALEYLTQALHFFERTGNLAGVANALGNMGMIARTQKDYETSLKYLYRCLEIDEKLNNLYSLSNTLNNIGLTYQDKGDHPQSLIYFQKSLTIRQKIGDQAGISACLVNIGIYYQRIKDYQNSSLYLNQGLAIATELRLLDHMKEIMKILAKVDSARGDYKSAFEHYKRYTQYKDSLFNAGKSQEIGRLEAKYQYDKEKEAHAREEAIAAEKRTWIAFTTGGGIVILLSFMGVLYKNYREKKRINQQLLEQNEEISSQNEQIALQRDELNHYNSKLLENNALLNEQNEEIRAQSEQISQQRDQLEQTNAQLKALDEFKEAMAGMIVHDLKNPLNAIIGLSAKNDLRENDRVMIHQAGKQMLNLTLNILDVQKFEQADVPLNLQDHPLVDIASDAFAQVSLLATNKNLKLLLEIESGTGVHADFELISRVFMNLLTNAIKYTPNNGKITISADKTDHQIRIGVSDTGQGIPADKLHTVFDKFSQVEAKKSGIARSTGLGLTFCKMVVEAHGGRIGVTSEVGIGTTFYFNLPEALTQVTATEQPVEMIKETLELNEEDKNVLVEYLPALQALDVYEGSEVLQILASIIGSPAVHHWKNEIENAIFSSNQERYEELVSI